MTQYAVRAESELTGPVRQALGDRFAEFHRLAKLLAEQPDKAAYVKAEMARILDAMPAAERSMLRLNLHADGRYATAAKRATVHKKMVRAFPGLR